MKLPDRYTENMKYMLGDEYTDYISCLSRDMYHALRVNTHKISTEDFLKICPFDVSPVPWCKNGFYYDASKDVPSKHPFYFAGLYYLQEPSAMVPASMIPIEKGDKVLDICAAPGGKSTELAARLDGTGFLVSNDISASRLKALIKNMEVFGIENMLITCESPDRLADKYEAYFDKILIDAPCSGEGMFRKSNSMINAWTDDINEKYAAIQRSILKEAVKMIKPGGTILYSTCTFSPLEDEDSVNYLLSLDKNLSIRPVEMYDGFEPGHPEWSKETENEDIRQTAHIFPHRVKGEGHFVSMVDMSENSEGIPHTSDQILKKYRKNDDVQEFLSHISRKIPADRIEQLGERLFYIPEGCPDSSGLRVLRRGVYLGEIKKNRFEPSASFAMILNAGEFDNVLDLDHTDPNVYKYLRGETLDMDMIDTDQKLRDGYVLIAVNGYPLGFGKHKNGVIKNKYLPGWRMT